MKMIKELGQNKLLSFFVNITRRSPARQTAGRTQKSISSFVTVPKSTGRTLVAVLSLWSVCLSAQEQFNLPVQKNSFYLSASSTNPGRVFWNDADSSAVYECHPRTAKFNWGYIAFNIPAEKLDSSIRTVRITLKVELPDGLTVTIAMAEENLSYDLSTIQVEPGEWGTLTLPLNKFKPSSWNRKADDNRHLDPDQCRTILVGFSGLPAAPNPAAVRIAVKEIVFLP